jgi:hypothetical protein
MRNACSKRLLNTLVKLGGRNVNVTHAWGYHPTSDTRHNYRGNFKLHLIVENTFNTLARTTDFFHRKTRCFSVYKLLRVPYIIVWGLNCHFPLKDVMKYVAFWVRHATL